MIKLNFNGPAAVTSGADGNAIAILESQLGRALPDDYRDLMTITNGFTFPNGLVIYPTDDVFERNMTFEVPDYAPGYLSIGDDSGGQSILIPYQGDGVFLIDQGSMDPNYFEKLDSSLAGWLANGCPTR